MYCFVTVVLLLVAGCLVNCDPASPDRVPLKASLVSEQIVGPECSPTKVACNPGFWLLSCGLVGINLPDTTAFTRGINRGQSNVPNNDQGSCNCTSQNECGDAVRCFAWCVNIDPKLSTAMLVSHKQVESTIVHCSQPTHKVTSCSVVPLSLPIDKSFYSAYAVPTPSGDGCECVAGTDKGVECRAHCVTNIINYEVLSHTYNDGLTTNGWHTVACSGSNVLLGCALKPATNEYSTEFFRSYSVDDSANNRCRCHSGTRGLYMTCFAMCGQFV